MHKINTQSLLNNLNIPNKIISHLFNHSAFKMASKMVTLMLIINPTPCFFFSKIALFIAKLRFEETLDSDANTQVNCNLRSKRDIQDGCVKLK